MLQDVFSILQWWSTLLVIGIIFFPATALVLNELEDRGYAFSKFLGALIISYIIFVLGLTKLMPFTTTTIIIVGIFLALLNLFLLKKYNIKRLFDRKNLKIIIAEEILFLIAMGFWSYIKAHEPSIHGLEKFMDYGFINSILKSQYFPPKDMWYPPFPINYYYFGHLLTAVLTKASRLSPFITYNLMVATLFAAAFILPFSLTYTTIKAVYQKAKRLALLGALMAGLLVALSGNLHVMYSFFKPYINEKPQPITQLEFSPKTFPNNYWYPNATRFIPFTIHEFPLYSFVVSDLHGHVLDIPFVFLTLAFLYTLFIKPKMSSLQIVFLSFLIAMMYTTNALDGPIYILLALLIILIKNTSRLEFVFKSKANFIPQRIKNVIPFLIANIKYGLLLLAGFIIFTIPFNSNFKPFVSGIGVVCAPDALINKEKLGPFLFEKDHCQRSELYQLLTLHGFFALFVISFLIFLWRKKEDEISPQDKFFLILIVLSTLLIITPEFIYAKDIYPAHYRANTMFKLVYQSFMMLSLVVAYVFIRIISRENSDKKFLSPRFLFFIISFPLIILVMIYPHFAISSYFNQLKEYKGLDGIQYLKTLHLDDYKAIHWINKTIKGQPVLLEAQGDSYTDYERISANTGLPTVIGWAVHEWLWRGSYEIAAPRIEEVKIIYESTNLEKTKELLQKHKVEYVYVGDLEREKYPTLNEEKFKKLGKVVFQSGNTRLYKLYE